jgi:hypothetical protein
VRQPRRRARISKQLPPTLELTGTNQVRVVQRSGIRNQRRGQPVLFRGGAMKHWRITLVVACATAVAGQLEELVVGPLTSSNSGNAWDSRPQRRHRRSPHREGEGKLNLIVGGLIEPAGSRRAADRMPGNAWDIERDGVADGKRRRRVTWCGGCRRPPSRGGDVHR